MAALARWSLVIPGDDDIDLYLIDSDGETSSLRAPMAAPTSTSSCSCPADDTYTMAVHGWAVGSATGLPFSLQSWIVPLASGGSLTVDAAPTEAVTGATGTVTVGWAGLTAGTSYLGAVSHNDDAGLIALTAVSVEA